MFLEMTDKFQRMEENDCENTSFVQSETRTKVLHNVNLYMFELEKKKKRSLYIILVGEFSIWRPTLNNLCIRENGFLSVMITISLRE